VPTNGCEVRVLFGRLLPSRVGCAQTPNEEITVHRHHSRVCCLRLLKSLNATSHPLHHDQLCIYHHHYLRVCATRLDHGMDSCLITCAIPPTNAACAFLREYLERIRVEFAPTSDRLEKAYNPQPLAHSRW